jgi:hypothetical protein
MTGAEECSKRRDIQTRVGMEHTMAKKCLRVPITMCLVVHQESRSPVRYSSFDSIAAILQAKNENIF